jgi:hypothetical protein
MNLRFYLTLFSINIIYFLCIGKLEAQKPLNRISAGFPVNYSEDSVGIYTLPDLFTMQNGTKIVKAEDWMKKRRPGLLSLLESIQFGKTPPSPAKLLYRIFDKGTLVMNGKALRKQVTIFLTSDTLEHKVDIVFYLPVNSAKPVPLFLNISFMANSASVSDSTLMPGIVWTRDGKRVPALKAFMPAIPDMDKFILQGIGVATLYYGDIEPDFKKGFEFGIRKYYSKTGNLAADEWGAISAWSWGLSRVMDYIEKDQQMDAKRIALFGISRLGKTVLWTGARDSRFKLVIASCSGEGGAALSRRNYGENLLHITDTSRYFYQFAAKYHSFAPRINELPFDAHALVALMAPRPLLLQTGDTDYWSDPKGEFLSAIAAEPIYKLFGLKGPGTNIMPQSNDTSLLLNPLGYYMHSGGHGTVQEDWDKYILFLKKFL